MGRVIVPVKVENLDDLFGVQKKLLAPDEVRTIVVTDALVDTGSTLLGMPKRLIDQLGLVAYRTGRARTAAGSITRQVYQAVRLTIQGRDCNCDVMELPDDCPVLVGQIPLEALDWVVDPAGQRLIGNPAHGGEYVIDMY